MKVVRKIIKLIGIGLITVTLLASCGTSKGCDCPSFGANNKLLSKQ